MQTKSNLKQDLKERAEKALDKKASYGQDFDLSEYEIAPSESEQVETLTEWDEKTQKQLLNTGVVPSGEGRSGSLVVLNNAVSYSSTKSENVELIPTKQAREKYDWLDDYAWNLVPVDTDKYTAATYLQQPNGYFIRAHAGKKETLPVQTCLLLGNKEVSQTVHNIIIVEENAELEIITGCTTKEEVMSGLHLGISEMYVKKGGKLTFTMIHNWAEDIGVRPRTKIKVEEGGTFINNYIALKPVKSIQSYPTAFLDGKGAVARFNTIAVGHPGSELDLGSKVEFNSPETKAELISRTITTGGNVVARGEMVGNADNAKGHLECRGLVLSDDGSQRAIPILEANLQNVELTHEAAVGKIARDQVEYLMSRGLSEDEAVGMIVRGFLDVGIKGLPEELESDINETIDKIGEHAM
ncbi:SufBD protein [Methanohalobium evestigatum Z-7303]|uniref:SufBD protein n=1 Tax=Methanohalobium evestigatum (strain ATCC BAA-1072 / DSM 3721 / NBRC 107634 / OCM 161 / Z-7303) TaxID=644295 RepID=D7EBI1_METEZ|nr:SufD family Fe-S cluster assembly protein [Methanohalobium evestigatum]ADI74823.1 SufBD protein [Methanohalobium evestigatum Z-7303]